MLPTGAGDRGRGARRFSPATRAAGRFAGRPGRDAAFRRRVRVRGDPGVRPHAVPRQPRLADPADVRALGGHRRAQPRAGRRDRRRGRRRAHRLLRRRGHRSTPRCARSARGCCRCSTRSATDGAVAAARADRRPGPVAVRRGRGPRALPRRARPPPGASGICLDTCHVFAAGAPLDEPGGTTATVDRLVEIAGPGRLRLVHANDSMDVRGAFKDRHQRIGDGLHRARRLRGAARAPGHRRRAVRPRDARLPRRRTTRRSPLLQKLRASACSAGRDRRTDPARHARAARHHRLLGLDVLPDQGPARPGAGAGLPGACGSRSPASRCSLLVPAGAAAG